MMWIRWPLSSLFLSLPAFMQFHFSVFKPIQSTPANVHPIINLICVSFLFLFIFFSRFWCLARFTCVQIQIIRTFSETVDGMHCCLTITQSSVTTFKTPISNGSGNHGGISESSNMPGGTATPGTPNSKSKVCSPSTSSLWFFIWNINTNENEELDRKYLVSLRQKDLITTF